MKKKDGSVCYPYACPDCSSQPFRSRASYTTHRRAKHPEPDVDPTLYDPTPLRCDVLGVTASEIQFGESGHGPGALPTLDIYDEHAR